MKKRQLEYEYSLRQKIILILLFATYYFYKFALTNCILIKGIGGKEQYWMMHRICSFMKMWFEEI